MKDSDIAVIGLAGRFPGAPDVASFWRNLRAGRESITFFSDEELAAAGIAPALLGRPDYVKATGLLEGTELFDAGLFGLSPREAEITDPQLRLFLECALEALEDAGHGGTNAPGLIGVYAGTNLSSYLWELLRHPALLSTLGTTRLLLGNDKDYLATWTSYKLNLRGPSLSVQTACSTSLVAVHLACQALANGECDIALAGGAAVGARQRSGYLYREDDILSPDGHCRPFDALARGTVGGNGVGIVALRRLDDALEDGDTIRAVLKGTAINNDGSLKVGYTAPAVDGQARAITEAIAVAEVDPDSIDYVEAHGTGTALGDPVEVAALNKAFSRRTRPCLLGAVKANVGHLDAAAGVTGLIKTILALEHGEIPATPHFQSPNPRIDFGPFRVVSELTAWRPNGRPRRAGVSSFGIGGTNAHVIVEEAPEQEPSGPSRDWQVLPLSAKTAGALESVTADLERHLSALPGIEPNGFADVAFTLQAGRRALSHRRVVVCRDAAEAWAVLSSLDPKRVATAVTELRHRPVFFLFPGQGAQHAGMTEELYASEPGFRRRVDASAEILRGLLGFDLRRVLYPSPAEREAAGLRLQETAVTQPALFVVEHALAELWMEWGVRPRGMLGHSLGEYVAACLAGVLTLPDALHLVAERGRLMGEMPPGAMLSVPRPAEEIAALLDEEISLAALNAPDRCTISGPVEAVQALARRLAGQGIESRLLRTSHAFHSRLMEPAAERFAREVAAVPRKAPKLRYIANLTGTWVSDSEVAEPAFWARQLREPVRFAAGVAELLREEAPILLEVGPGAALTGFARRQLAPVPGALALSSLPRPEEPGSEVQALLRTAGRLWLHGVEIDWLGFHADERRRRVPLPTYPFERRRYWIDPPAASAEKPASPPVALSPDGWLYTPTWKRVVSSRGPATPADIAGRWIVYDDGGGIAAGLRARLEAQGVEVLRIGREDGRRAGGLAGLLDRWHVTPREPLAVVHLWSAPAAGDASLAELQESGYDSLLDLAHALEARRIGAPVTLWVVTSGMHEVTGEEALVPGRATLLGPCRVIPQEMPNVRCRHVDIVAPAPGSPEEERLIDRLAVELASPEGPPAVACRGAFLWVPEMVPLPPRGGTGSGSRLRPGGVYLITGGLGNVGLALARHLAAAVRARLVLTRRSPFPARDGWDDPGHGPEVERKIRALREIEALGGEVSIAEADVADAEVMARVVGAAEERFGPLNGVLHAAGQVGPRAYHSLPETGPAESREQFHPKIDGTLALERALAGRRLDFCVLVSSLSAILGGLGFTAYAAANLYLDAFAAERNRTSPFPWITIDWDGWRFEGDAPGPAPAVTPGTGGFILDRALAMDSPRQVVVSASDLGERLRRWVERSRPAAAGTDGEREPELLHPRPGGLATAYAEPVSDSEKRLAELWRGLLGIDRVGLHDNFFELGGDSLLATQLFSRIRQEMGAGIPLRTIFEAPTIAGLAAVVDRAAEEPATPAAPPLLPVPRDVDLPLSFAQQRLWFLHQLDPHSPAYNIHVPFRLHGRLSLAAFQAALSELARRHEVLRSTFRMGPDGPVQIPHPPAPLPVPLVDLEALPARRRDEELLRLGLDESRRPFDLGAGPLLRVLVVRLGDDDQAILAPKHHIVTDLWSEWLFVREITILYAAFCAGRPSPLPDLPVQYADFAWWQHEWLRSGALDPALDYWKAQLAGAPPLVELPTDHPRPALQTHEGASRHFLLPARLAASLAGLGQAAGATSFMVLLAGFSALLGRLTGGLDLPIGTPVANRNRLETEGLIGFFVNTLVLRSDLSGEPSFAELLRRTRSTTLAAFSHQDLPFEKLVKVLDPLRSLVHTPLFQVMLSYYNAPPAVAAQEAHAFTVRPLAVAAVAARFDLELQLADSGDGIGGDLIYNRDLFDEPTVQRLAGHFVVLLSAAAAAPSSPLSELPLLSPGERHQVLREWNDTATVYPVGLCLHALVAAQAERTPDAVAVSFEGECLTYRELVRRARRLSRHLVALNVEPDDRVGVLLERSLEMIVGLLGVLEAGAAYVPLDPGLPAERLGVLVESAGLAVVLTLERHSALVPVRGERVLRLDTDWSGLEGEAGAIPPSLVREQSLAYVLYTSGSTGAPKGVMISHQGIVNRLLWMQEAYGLTAADRVLQKTPFGFDVSLWELFWPLLTGARLVFAQPEGHKDPRYLVELIAREGITTLHFVPSMLEVFLEAQGLELLTSLRRVMASGEALPPRLVRRFFARLGGAELHNLYGPTEASVDVSFWPCVPEPPSSLVPIGRPIANHRLHVVDRHLGPQPVGVPGELLLGGPGLARGYLGRPDLTAGVFIPDPLGRVPGDRLYRTGDLVRLLPDGNVQFLGRIDHQVKVRGFRIELGEIESVLAGHPGVRAAAVLLRNDLPGGNGLVAYVVGDEEAQEVLALRGWLEERLPGYMVPAAFVRLESLPLTPNGKVDRRALPAPEADQGAASFIAPRNSFEEALALIWGEVLGVAAVGRESNFFEMGGDSIQVVRLVSRMNEELGSSFKVPDLFRYQTIAALAAQSATIAGRVSVEQERAAGLKKIESLCQAILDDPQQKASLPAGYEDFFPLSDIEKGMIYYSLLLPEEPVYHDQFVYLLPIADAGRFFEALGRTMERHSIFRTSFHVYSFAEPIKVVHRELRLEREVEDLAALDRPGQLRRIDEYRASDVEHNFRFDGEVLWRFKLFRLRDDLHCAVLTFHHSMLDGWSVASFWVEVNNLYAGQNRLEILPPPASSYKDFLAITLGRKSSEETAGFWRETLRGVKRNRLPFNRVKVQRPQARGMGIVHRRLNHGLLAALRAAALAHHVPLRTLALTAYVWLLHVIAAEDEVVTGVVTHERPEIRDGDRILGCFLNTIPVRIDAAGVAGSGPLVRAVDSYLREAREHEILLGDIVTAVGHRETADNPFFDTIFNFIDFHILTQAAPQSLPGSPPAARVVERYDLEAKEMTNTLFDLEVMATLGELAVKVKYSPRHFDETDARRAADLYVRVLERLAGDPEAGLDPEALLTAAERSEIVDRFNDTRVGYVRETPVFRLIEARAAELPDHTAVSCAGESLTYRELNRAANRLARHLLRQGARPGDNIGVIYPRSVDLAVALMAILKMGGAYVPLEPDYPPMRKGYMVRNSGVTRIVADRLYELAGSPGGGAAFILPEPAGLAGESGSDLDVAPRPDDLVYTIYTSGSTGNPKGVMIEHHSVVNLVHWVNRELAIGPGASVLMLSSVCFDLSVYDLFGGLSAGARVVLAREEDLKDPARLQRLLAEERITFWSSVPSTMGLLVQFLEDVDPEYRQESLAVVFLSGDWIPLPLPGKIRKFFPNARVVSLGGATEGTVWSIFHPIDRVDESWASIPYGRPLDNNTFYILDRRLSVVPPGVVGDLYIGGAGVAKGYANDPEKTAGSFLPDRFTAESGARMYRTGDLGRMLPDGNIEFLGRADHQVKIRGFRIELGEVESQLLRHPSIRDAVVIARADGVGEKYLCAYVVAETLPSPPELKAYLAAALPEYMIPAAFVPLPALPLTDNGKLDRRALPDPEVANLSTSARFVAPAGEVETALVGIWEEVLGIDGIGTSHDFFELGGHSLLAVQVITRIRRQLGAELPLRVLFDAPTVAGLAAQVEALRSVDAVQVQERALGRADRSGPLPLSFAQQRLWFLDQLQPGSPVYNLPVALRLRGELSIPALRASLSEVVRRHESLRTVFTTVDGQPVQRIQEPTEVPLPVIDLGGLAPDRVDGELARWAREHAERPFDLAAGPLLRSSLVRLGEAEHAVLLNQHHVVSDGWSRGLLVREVVTLYGASLVAGRPSPLPELPVQYADFAVWQRGWLAGEVLERQLDYWRSRLAGLPVLLELATDRPRPAFRTGRGAHRPFHLPLETWQGLKALGRREGVTDFMTLLALFQAFLGRLAGQEDLAVGTVVANRDRAELEPLIGFFANTLVMRGDLSGQPGPRDLLLQVRESALGAYAHQDLPFEHLVEALQPVRATSYTPLFQVMLVLQNVPQEALSLSGLEAVWIEGGNQTGGARFDLTLDLVEAPRGLIGTFEYAADLFDRTTIERWSIGFARLLASALASPGARSADLPLLGAAERQQLVLEWNDTSGELSPLTGSLPARFEARAAERPDAVAAVFAGTSLTYGELDRWANRLAHRLLETGVAPGSRVCLAVERGLGLVAGILGILKAGCAYVPLDPSYPQERLAWMLDDAGAAALVSEEGMLERLPAWPGAVLLLGERSGPERLRGREESPRVAVAPQWPAYVIYTSGSTGHPKGVVVSHGNVLRLMATAEEWLGFGAEEVWTLFHSFAFDFSVWELWGALLYGGRLVVVPYLTSRLPEAMLELVEREKVTVLSQTPSAFRAFQQAEAQREDAGGPSLRWVIFGGEALEPRSLETWWRRRRQQGMGTPGLVNMYGITETTVHVTWRRLGEAEILGGGGSVIGMPLRGWRVHVLDRRGESVPVGVAGELHVGGAGVSTGYLGRPELTAERFVPDGLGEEPGARLYRSGDLGRRRSTGELEYLGRIDHQVKVRGFRIELGEIEAVLASHPAVREVVVLLRPDLPGGGGLVACVVAAEEWVRPLRRWVEERLPGYMVPAAFVRLESLPRTSNDKVDRRALERIAPAIGPRGSDSLAQPTPTEELLAGIWEDVLGLEGVGREESFFELGGHSLLATRVTSRVKDIFGITMPLRALFDTPTVAGLALQINALRPVGAAPSRTPLGRADRSRPLPLSFAQQRLWFLDQLDPGNPAYNIPAAMSLAGRLGVAALAAALDAVVLRHEALRTTFGVVAGEPAQILSPGVSVALPVIDLQCLPAAAREREAERLAEVEAWRPFDLGRDLLLRSVLLRLRAEHHVILLTMHHIVSDGWSRGVLKRELALLYETFLAGRPSPLPSLPIQYADFAVWQREWLQGERLEEQLAYWTRHLSGAPPFLALPFDRPRPARPSHQGGAHRLRIPPEVAALLKALGRSEGTTLFMTLLAAWVILLHRYSGQSDLVIGSNIANRHLLSLEGLIGLFANTVALRIAWTEVPTVRELLARVREVVLEAQTHQDFPFEKLVEALRPERDAAYHPIFQVMLVMQEASPRPSAGSTPDPGPVSLGGRSAKFDLTLFVMEEGDGIGVELEYDADLFEGSTIADLLRQLATLLEALPASVDRPVSALHLVSAAEEESLVGAFAEDLEL